MWISTGLLHVTSRCCGCGWPGYAKWPAADPSEKELLVQLFAVALGGDAQLHSRLVDALIRLTETCGRWKEAGASPLECMSILLPVAQALGSLKIVVGC